MTEPAAKTEPAANFPLGLYEEFLQVLVERDVNVITYDDIFRDCDDYHHLRSFPDERSRWAATADPSRAHLLIQHDVDNHPKFTSRVLDMERAHGIRSNVFIFVTRWSRRYGAAAPYNIDHGHLTDAERDGFVIGYHQNVMQLCDFNLERAEERFLQDVATLRERYDVRFVVPHGGRGAEVNGRMIYNHDLPLPKSLEGDIRWVFNKHGLRWDRQWSDGGISRSRDPKRLRDTDIIAFARGLQPGERAFCLAHPQRWGLNVNPSLNPMLAREPWYVEACRRHGVDVTLLTP